jgi:hypothetical protein
MITYPLPTAPSRLKMDKRFQIANIAGQELLCHTEALARLFKRGHHWALIDTNDGTVRSLHTTRAWAAHTAVMLNRQGENAR